MIGTTFMKTQFWFQWYFEISLLMRTDQTLLLKSKLYSLTYISFFVIMVSQKIGINIAFCKQLRLNENLQLVLPRNEHMTKLAHHKTAIFCFYKTLVYHVLLYVCMYVLSYISQLRYYKISHRAPHVVIASMSSSKFYEQPA